jgi:hypothetical protein
MKFQLISNLWGKYPTYFQARAPTLILAGNIGHLQSPKTWDIINMLSYDFDTVFWVPYAAETFTLRGSYYSDQVIRAQIYCKTKNVKVLNNDVVTHENHTLIGSSGWTKGVTEGPIVDNWAAEDRDFINDNCGADAVLITAGSTIYKKPKHVIVGTEPCHSGRPYIANDASTQQFCANKVFTLE